MHTHAYAGGESAADGGLFKELGGLAVVAHQSTTSSSGGS